MEKNLNAALQGDRWQLPSRQIPWGLSLLNSLLLHFVFQQLYEINSNKLNLFQEQMMKTIVLRAISHLKLGDLRDRDAAPLLSVSWPFAEAARKDSFSMRNQIRIQSSFSKTTVLSSQSFMVIKNQPSTCRPWEQTFLSTLGRLHAINSPSPSRDTQRQTSAGGRAAQPIWDTDAKGWYSA